MTTLDRIHARTERSGDCILWIGCRNTNGYGQVRHNRRPVLVHRLVYQLTVGPIPPGLGLMHSCDNPACINVLHLRPGTQKENMQDASRKGRMPRTNAILTPDDIPKILSLVASKSIPKQDIAKQFGISKQSLSCILHGRSWKSTVDALARAEKQETLL